MSTPTITAYSRRYVAYPGWHAYSTYGLVPALSPFPGLAFLSAGFLLGSYIESRHTVYVYVVNEDDVQKEYRVADNGQILSAKVVSGP